MSEPTSFAIRLNRRGSFSNGSYYDLVSDRSTLLTLPPDEPIYDSPESCALRIASLHPAPHPHLSFVLPDQDPVTWYTRFHLLDEPVYAGPQSPSALSELLFRFPGIWVRDDEFMRTLPPPFRLTSRKLYVPSQGAFRRLIHSSAVSKRIATRRSNIEADRSELLSGGSFMPPPIFEGALSFPGIRRLNSYLPSSHRNLISIHHKKAELSQDLRPPVLDQLGIALERILAQLPDKHNSPIPPRALHRLFSLDDARAIAPLLPWLRPLQSILVSQASGIDPTRNEDHPLNPYYRQWTLFFEPSHEECGSKSLSPLIDDTMPWEVVPRAPYFWKLSQPTTSRCSRFLGAIARYFRLTCLIHRIPPSSLTSPAPLDILPSDSTPQETDS